jgi:benzaldehyde dehydrogenase (NAD)
MSTAVMEPRASADSERLVSSESWNGKVFDDDWNAASKTLTVREPATGEMLGEVGASDRSTMAQTVARQGGPARMGFLDDGQARRGDARSGAPDGE